MRKSTLYYLMLMIMIHVVKNLMLMITVVIKNIFIRHLFEEKNFNIILKMFS